MKDCYETLRGMGIAPISALVIGGGAKNALWRQIFCDRLNIPLESVENMPSEGVLEEIDYFLFDPQQGFCLQCLYTSDGEINGAYRVKKDELVEFPKGYPNTAGAPGCNTCFLRLMAGKHQGVYRGSNPQHAWIGAVENLVKKQ